MSNQADRLHLGIDQNRLQDKTEAQIRSLANNLLMQGRLIEIDLTGAFQDIAHKLGRRWQGYFVIATDTAIDTPVWEASRDETRFLRLKSSAAAAAKLWVF